MSLSRQDAIRILRFCLGPDDTGLATGTDDSCVVTVALCSSSYEVHRFEAPTYEQALRSAAGAGVLKAACVNKQIAFLSRTGPSNDAGTAASGPAGGAVAAQLAEMPEPFVELARATAAFLHEAQRERGYSALFVGSAGRLFGTEVAGQRARTDERRAALAPLRERVGPIASPALLRRWQRAETLLAPLATLRAAVDEHAVGAPHVIETFSEINAALLAMLDGSLVTEPTGSFRTVGLAALALLHAKEKTGIERARLGTVLLAGHVDDGERLSLASLVAAQESYLHVFSTAAPSPAEQLMRRVLAGPPALEVRRIEHLILSEKRPPDIDAGAWFATVTRKIDALGEIGDSLLGPDVSRPGRVAR
jgi:hypothetical protein